MPYPNPRSALVALATPFALPAFLVLLLTISAAWGEDTNMDTTGYTPRAVILIIGDGMDDQQISIARNYLKGAAGKLLLDTLLEWSSIL